jgi:hypothetical protein
MGTLGLWSSRVEMPGVAGSIAARGHVICREHELLCEPGDRWRGRSRVVSDGRQHRAAAALQNGQRVAVKSSELPHCFQVGLRPEQVRTEGRQPVPERRSRKRERAKA